MEDWQGHQKAESGVGAVSGGNRSAKRRRSKLALDVAKVGREHKVDPAALWRVRLKLT